MEINRIVSNQTANFWQWQGVDYALFCQNEPICEFTDAEDNIAISGYETPTIKPCKDTGVGYKYPFKAGDEYSFAVPLSIIGTTPLSTIRLGLSAYGQALMIDIATVEIVGSFAWFKGTLPRWLKNGYYEFIIYSDTGNDIVLDLIAKTNNLNDTDCLGVIEVLATGGLEPYEYSLDGINYQSSGLFENLCNAVYTVWVRDGNCNGQVITVEIRTFPGCEFFNDKTLEYLCNNRWTLIDLCSCNFNCE
jgi:hypothetical protein